MKTVGNVLWFIFTGLLSGIAWYLLGLIWCITIIGIPFGKQCFKLGRLSFWPFGTVVIKDFGAHPIANVIWIIFSGLILALSYCLVGVIWCITIIGIPFGKQCFKLAGLAITPFGATFGEKVKAE
ncbi:MAG TPA: YccF domain-containing protein [Clostridiales bacterium]|nr:YccF domain-containing protein [Clostridiales bacterium]